MENLNDLTKEENYYYNILEDMLFNGDIDESERNILNKRKEEFKISDSRAKELEDFAKLNNSNSLFEEGKAHYFDKEYDKAIEVLKKAIELNPDKTEYWYRLGISYTKCGQYQLAKESFQKAVKLNSNNKEAEKEILGIPPSISESKATHFKTEGEEDYYKILEDMLLKGDINESERKEEFTISDSRVKELKELVDTLDVIIKNKEKISDSRAKELEELENLIKLNSGVSSYNENNKNSENNEVFSESKTPQFETDGEKDYYELLVDMLESGTIYGSERGILDKIKYRYGISYNRAKELEDFAKKEILGITSSISESKTPYFQTKNEEDYYKLLIDMRFDFEHTSQRDKEILNRNSYGISKKRAKELKRLAIEEIRKLPKNNTLQFKTEGEKYYYELFVDILDKGYITGSERNMLNKIKNEYKIFDSRAKELENFALEKLKPKNDSETSYYRLILDFIKNGYISQSNREILVRRMKRYDISEERAKELEVFAKFYNEKQNIGYAVPTESSENIEKFSSLLDAQHKGFSKIIENAVKNRRANMQENILNKTNKLFNTKNE